MSLLNRARMIGRRFGIEIQRANAHSISARRICHFLRTHSIDVVLDVGANDGGYATSLFDAGYAARIYSFEPLQDAWHMLRKRASWNSNWHVLPPVALSDREGHSTFHKSANSVSSSLLTMTPLHVAASPGSDTKEAITIRTKTLDSYMSAIEPKRAFLKIDVQGAERLVLDGASKGLKTKIFGIQMEMSLTELYAGQPLSHDLHTFITSRGFSLWDVIPGFRDQKTLRLMQYDGIYFRE